jgi:hypothetical protein
MDKRFNLPFCWILLSVAMAMIAQLWPLFQWAPRSETFYAQIRPGAATQAWVWPLVFGVTIATLVAFGVRYIRWLAWVQFWMFIASVLLHLACVWPFWMASPPEHGRADPEALSTLDILAIAAFVLEWASLLAFAGVTYLAIRAIARSQRRPRRTA